MRTSVRVAVTLCMVAVAIFAGFHLWQYYMLHPGLAMRGSAPTWW